MRVKFSRENDKPQQFTREGNVRRMVFGTIMKLRKMIAGTIIIQIRFN